MINAILIYLIVVVIYTLRLHNTGSVCKKKANNAEKRRIKIEYAFHHHHNPTPSWWPHSWAERFSPRRRSFGTPYTDGKAQTSLTDEIVLFRVSKLTQKHIWCRCAGQTNKICDLSEALSTKESLRRVS